MVDATGPQVIRLSDLSMLPEVLRSNGISTGRPVLACVGGAAGLLEKDLSALTELLRDDLIPAINRWAVTIVDGGTDSGIMRLVGRARLSLNCSFQLIGVAAAGTVRQPGSAEPVRDDAADIEPNHSHVILVPGDSWGDETPWLSAVVGAIAAGVSSATLVVNGGSVTMNDALTSLNAQRPVIILDGSGRAADEIARATDETSESEQANAIAASPLTRIVPMEQPERIVRTIKSALKA
jgi:SLOG in TRPM, prokaryote